MAGDKESVTAMVLYSGAVGDYDKRVVLLTRQKGKIAAFARGARRQGSQLMAAVMPFCYGEFSLYAGRDYYVITDARPERFFDSLGNDIYTACMASYFAEVMNFFGHENADTSQLLLHLYASLRELEKKRLPSALVRSVFELRTLALEGVFSPDAAGTDCSPGAQKALQHIASSDAGSLYAFSVSREVEKEISGISARLFGAYTGRHFTSLDILDTVGPAQDS